VNGWFEQPRREITPCDFEVTVYETGLKKEGKVDWEWDKSKPIYFDESCFNQKVKGYEVAGGAAIQIDEVGRCTAGVYAPVPRSYPQTSMAGEHVGVILIGLGTGEDTTLKAVDDRLTIVKDSGKSTADKLFWRKPYAGVWKELQQRRIQL
jgi:hypothetical protein